MITRRNVSVTLRLSRVIPGSGMMRVNCQFASCGASWRLIMAPTIEACQNHDLHRLLGWPLQCYTTVLSSVPGEYEAAWHGSGRAGHTRSQHPRRANVLREKITRQKKRQLMQVATTIDGSCYCMDMRIDEKPHQSIGKLVCLSVFADWLVKILKQNVAARKADSSSTANVNQD